MRTELKPSSRASLEMSRRCWCASPSGINVADSAPYQLTPASLKHSPFASTIQRDSVRNGSAGSGTMVVPSWSVFASVSG
jgi:hypothetical protein